MVDDFIKVRCPDCGYQNKTRRQHIGKRGKCRRCDRWFEVTHPSEPGPPIEDLADAVESEEVDEEEAKATDRSIPYSSSVGGGGSLWPGGPTVDRFGRTPFNPESSAPSYWAMKLAGRILEVIGFIGFVLCLVLSVVAFLISLTELDEYYRFRDWLNSLGPILNLVLGLIGGVFCIASGQLLHVIRDVAITVYLYPRLSTSTPV